MVFNGSITDFQSDGTSSNLVTRSKLASDLGQRWTHRSKDELYGWAYLDPLSPGPCFVLRLVRYNTEKSWSFQKDPDATVISSSGATVSPQRLVRSLYKTSTPSAFSVHRPGGSQRSKSLHQIAGVAQWNERLVANQKVVGSIPTIGSKSSAGNSGTNAPQRSNVT